VVGVGHQEDVTGELHLAQVLGQLFENVEEHPALGPPEGKAGVLWMRRGAGRGQPRSSSWLTIDFISSSAWSTNHK
jgi:hypothetical protein